MDKSNVVIDQRNKLEKLEHRINIGIKNIAQNMANILISLNEIKTNKLYLLRNCKSLREYIIKQEYTKKLNLHISSIFLKLQIIEYGNKYDLDYQAIQQIGEAKFKVLVQTGKEIDKDFSIEDIKNTKLLSLENTLRNRDLSDTPTDKQKEKQCISFDIQHFKEIVINDREQEINIKINKTEFNKYLEMFKNVNKISFV